MLCLVLFFSEYSKAEDYVTDNLVTDYWHNTVTNTSVTGGEGSHNQGSGPVPLYNPDTNTITWSYGNYSVLNIIGINAALSAAGTGIRITGYNYSWEYYNQNFNRGFLSATTQQYGSDGTLLEQYYYQMPKTTDGWTLYSGTQNYSNQYQLTSLGNFALYFTGRDDRFWAGYYGPMVRNPSITFNYTIGGSEPENCYSLACPGYTPTFVEPSYATEPTQTTNESVIVETPFVDVSQTQNLTTQTNSPETNTTSESSGSRTSLSSVLNILANERSRISNVERSTVESSIDQSASQSKQAVQDAELISENSTTENTPLNVSIQDQSGESSLNFMSNTSSSSTLNSSFSSTSRSSDLLTNENIQTEELKNENASFSGFSAVNVLKEETNVSEQTNNEQKPETVKNNTLNNQLAGNVTIESLASTPQGFQTYLISIPDNQFYTPREIYRNQNVVDNPAGRRLFGGSDTLHLEMINEQYRR